MTETLSTQIVSPLYLQHQRTEADTHFFIRENVNLFTIQKPMNKTLSGSCICKGITFSSTETARNIIGCHCQECRKASGHFTAATAVKPEHLSINESRTLKWYRASNSAQRGFCSECGCSLFWKPDSGDRISIFAGSLDDTTGLTLTHHIFLAEKGDYYDIDDSTTPCFEYGGANLQLPE